MGLVWLYTYIYIYTYIFTIKINHSCPWRKHHYRPLFLVGGSAARGGIITPEDAAASELLRPLNTFPVSGLSLGENESDIMWTIELLGTHTLIENKQNKSKQFLPHQLAHETWDDKNTCSNPVPPRCFGVFRFSKLRYLMMLIFFGVFFEMVVPAMTA